MENHLPITSYNHAFGYLMENKRSQLFLVTSFTTHFLHKWLVIASLWLH